MVRVGVDAYLMEEDIGDGVDLKSGEERKRGWGMLREFRVIFKYHVSFLRLVI